MRKTTTGISRRDVLDAAVRAFAKKGYRGTNLNDVAVELGVTRQAIYYYYPSKQDILRELLGTFFRELNDRVEPTHTAAATPAEAFESMLAAHITYVAAVPDLAAVFTRENVSLDEQAGAEIQSQRRQYHDRFVETFAAAQRDGAFRGADPNAAVSLLLGATNWLFRWYRPDHPEGMSIDELTRTAIDLLAHGYRAPQADEPRP